MNQVNASNCNKKFSWPGCPAVKQNFSVLESIVYYAAKNPSNTKLYLKMVKICKYFFENNPILIVKRICNGETKICSSEDIYPKCIISGKCCIKIDIKKIRSKIWLTEAFTLYENANDVSLILSKIYRCEAALFQNNCSKMILEEFKLFTSLFEKYYFLDIEIVDNNGQIVMLEKILECIPSVKHFAYIFDYQNPAATNASMKNISRLTNFVNLQLFNLTDIPEVIAVEFITTFIKDHKDAKFDLRFISTISDGYKNQLDKLVDTIIASGVPNRLIFYDGQDKEKQAIMISRYADED